MQNEQVVFRNLTSKTGVIIIIIPVLLDGKFDLMKTTISIVLLIFFCELSYSQHQEDFVKNKFKHIKRILDAKKVKAIALTRTHSTIYSLDGIFENSIDADSVVYSKDGTYYFSKLYMSDGKTKVTEYKDDILTIDGVVFKGHPFFIKNANLFYHVFHIDDYDSCIDSEDGGYICKKNGRDYYLYFDENKDVIKRIGTQQKEFSDFEEIYGLRYATKIKERIKEEQLFITGVTKINTVTVLKESEY